MSVNLKAITDKIRMFNSDEIICQVHQKSEFFTNARLGTIYLKVVTGLKGFE